LVKNAFEMAKISVFGLGYVSAVTAAYLASKGRRVERERDAGLRGALPVTILWQWSKLR